MITCWPSLFRPADSLSRPDRAIIERAKNPRSYRSKDAVPRWAGAEFRDGYRSLANFLRAGWIVLDLDLDVPIGHIADAFSDYYGIAHRTWNGRWRVGLVLSRPVTLVDDAFGRVWRAGAEIAEAFGLAPDYKAHDASHCWALPARHDGDSYDYVELQGAFLDVDAALERFPKPEPLPEPRRNTFTDDYAHRLERASKYLAAMPGAISGAGGHACTFKAATALVRGFALEPDDALRLLAEEFNVRCSPPWSPWELKHKIKSALQKARIPFGAIADRTREARCT